MKYESKSLATYDLSVTQPVIDANLGATINIFLTNKSLKQIFLSDWVVGKKVFTGMSREVIIALLIKQKYLHK